MNWLLKSQQDVLRYEWRWFSQWALRVPGVLWISLFVALAVAACTPRDKAGDETVRDSGMPAAMPDTSAPAPPPPAAASGQDTMLETVEWSLLELNGKVAVGAGNRPLTLQLNATDKRAAGFAGCNRYTGSYERTGTSLRFGPMVMTRMACEGAMETEAAYAVALGKVTGWRITGGNLELLAGHLSVSEPFQRIALGLRARWQAMSACTAQSAPCGCSASALLH